MNRSELKNKINLKQKFSDNKFMKQFFIISFFIFLLISFSRVPYIGEFFDSIFFSFLFGWSKYIIYIYLFILIIYYWFKKIKKPMYSKRAFLLLFVTSFLFSCLFSSVFDYINKNDSSHIFTNYLNYWKKVVFPLNLGFNPFIYQNRIFVDGGILGTCICYLSSFIIIIISVLGIVGIYLLLATKHREKIFTFFKKRTKNKNNSFSLENDENKNENEVLELQNNNNDKNVIIDDSYLKSITNDWKKQHLTLEQTASNLNLDVEKIKTIILEFFANNNINFIKSVANENNDEFIVEFLMDDESYANFKQSSMLLKSRLSSYEFDSSYINHTLSIKFPKTIKFDNELLKKVLLIQYQNPFDVSFLTLNNSPLIINIKKNSFMGVFDPKDNNINNLIDIIIYSLSWTYKVEQLKIFYLSTKNIELKSFASPNFNKVDTLTSKDSLIFLKKISKEIQYLLKEFKKYNVGDIYSYNSLVSEKIQNKVILINDFNQLISINPEIKSYINEILENASRCGITIITFDKSNDAISYNNFNYQTTLLFKAPIDVSKRILNDSIASNLHDKNNAILFNAINKKSFEVQVPMISDNEEKIIISSLIDCYSSKKM